MKLTSKTINYTVNTVDELLTLAGEENSTVIVTDENRGGVFVYRSANATENNGGTIFNGWTRQYDGAVNVLWFGAKGDGVTDDTAAFQSAIDSLQNGYSLYIYDGNFLITGSVVFSTYGHIIYGGKNTRIIAGANIGAGMFNFSDKGGLKIRDIKFYTTSYNAVALYFYSTIQYENVIIEDCEFISGGYAPIYFGSLDKMISGFQVKNCDFLGDDSTVDAIDINFGSASPARLTFKPLLVENCVFKKYTTALKTSGTGFIYNTIFRNNSILDSNGRALHFYHNLDGVVESNTFDTYTEAVWVDGDTSVVGNKFLSSANDGLLVYNGSCTVSKNIVKDCANDGIIISVENNYGGIYNNQIRENGGNGIRVSAEPRGTSWTGSSRIYLANINGNDIIDNGKNGILIDDTNKDGTYGNSIDEVNIVGNIIGDNGTSDTTSLNVYSGIKVHYQHTEIIGNTKFHITDNNITDTLSAYMGTGNQYNAIYMDTPDAGGNFTFFINGNALLANSSGYWFKDSRRYGYRTLTNNFYIGLLDLASLGNRNTSGNVDRNKNQRTDTSHEGTTVEWGVSAAPTSGTYTQGSIAYNRLAVAGGNVGWVCVTAGSPGVWKAFGTIGA